MKNQSFSEIIDDINKFNLSTDFISWISGNNFKFSVLSEKNDAINYSRSIQFIVNHLTVLNGNIKILKTDLTLGLLENILVHKQPIGRYIALNPDSKITKQILSKTLDGSKYKIQSEFYYNKNILCGYCKEIFDLKNIFCIYLEKK